MDAVNAAPGAEPDNYAIRSRPLSHGGEGGEQVRRSEKIKVQLRRTEVLHREPQEGKQSNIARFD